MKITNLRVTTVTVPLEAPLRHASGAHWGRFVRTIIELETDEGITGLGEMGGGGESAELAFAGLRGHIIGENPFNLEGLRFKICNPTASLCVGDCAYRDDSGSLNCVACIIEKHLIQDRVVVVIQQITLIINADIQKLRQRSHDLRAVEC